MSLFRYFIINRKVPAKNIEIYSIQKENDIVINESKAVELAIGFVIKDNEIQQVNKTNVLKTTLLTSYSVTITASIIRITSVKETMIKHFFLGLVSLITFRKIYNEHKYWHDILIDSLNIDKNSFPSNKYHLLYSIF